MESVGAKLILSASRRAADRALRSPASHSVFNADLDAPKDSTSEGATSYVTIGMVECLL